MMRVAETKERELFAVMEGFEPEGTVAIGGYAVSARTVPRYSHDLDLVADAGEAERLRKFLGSRHLKLVRRKDAIEQDFGGSWERWQRGAQGPTVDLLPRSVQDRAFKIPFLFVQVARRADLLPLRGIHASDVSIRVASVETLIALKLQPMRRRDAGDIACLAGAGFDAPALRRLVEPLVRERPVLFGERLERLEQALGPDEGAAQRFLGSRIPGPPTSRIPYIRASRGLLRLLRGWAADG